MLPESAFYLNSSHEISLPGLNAVYLKNLYRCPGIIELFGPSGSGKSNFALQLLIETVLSNSDSKALYVCTESYFPITRLIQMMEARELPHEIRHAILSQILVHHLGDLETQEHFISFFLEPLIKQQKISLVVFDSISSNFRTDIRTGEVTIALYNMSFYLNCISFKHQCIVLCINQVSGDFSKQNESCAFKPALGLSWSNCVTSQLSLVRKEIGPNSVRILSLIRSPMMNTFDLHCKLTGYGFEVIEK